MRALHVMEASVLLIIISVPAMDLNVYHIVVVDLVMVLNALLMDTFALVTLLNV